MFEKISLVDLITTIKNNISNETRMDCYEDIQEKNDIPYFYLVFAGNQPMHTKTMFYETYSFHIIPMNTESYGNLKVYEMLTLLDKALYKQLVLPNGYTLVDQINKGVIVKNLEPINEKQFISQLDIKIN